MKDAHLGERLLDYLAGHLPAKDLPAIEEHLKGCAQCRKELEETREVLKAIDSFSPPPLSPEFKRETLQKLYEIPFPRKPLSRKIKEWFQIPALRWSFQGLAVAMALFIAIVAYREFTPSTEIRTGPPGPAIEAVKTPILVEAPAGTDAALKTLLGLLESHQGKLVRRRPIDGSLEVTVNVPKEAEPDFLKALSGLGTVTMQGDQYKDSDGNIVLRLKAL